MFADGKRVATRRWKRRVKAAASIVVAVAAGTFLACQRGAELVKGAVIIPDASVPVPPEEDAGVDAGIDAGRDAGASDAAVDVGEHRKGMPVRDNLLE
jgi:hypothetical protein